MGTSYRLMPPFPARPLHPRSLQLTCPPALAEQKQVVKQQKRLPGGLVNHLQARAWPGHAQPMSCISWCWRLALTCSDSAGPGNRRGCPRRDPAAALVHMPCVNHLLAAHGNTWHPKLTAAAVTPDCTTACSAATSAFEEEESRPEVGSSAGREAGQAGRQAGGAGRQARVLTLRQSEYAR